MLFPCSKCLLRLDSDRGLRHEFELMSSIAARGMACEAGLIETELIETELLEIEERSQCQMCASHGGVLSKFGWGRERFFSALVGPRALVQRLVGTAMTWAHRVPLHVTASEDVKTCAAAHRTFLKLNS